MAGLRLAGADPRPGPAASPLWRFAWEDSDQVVFPLDGTWMVRCSVETLECERAAGPISITPNDDINVPGAN